MKDYLKRILIVIALALSIGILFLSASVSIAVDESTVLKKFVITESSFVLISHKNSDNFYKIYGTIVCIQSDLMLRGEKHVNGLS